MGDEQGSEAEMGNRHGPGKKKKKAYVSNGDGEVSDAESDYRYVSIIDVNPPPSQYGSAAEESLYRSIEVNSPNGHNGEVSVSANSGEVLKCSVIIGEQPLENGHSVSRISVNGDFDKFMMDPAEHFRTPNGSSSFIEGVSDGEPSEEINGVQERLPGLDSVDGSLQEEVERVVREKLKRQRSGSSDYWNHDDSDDHCIVDFLDKINDHAEARLAAKRQARAEAREIRMRELERMQRESEDGDKVHDIYSTPDAVNRSVRAGSVATPRSLLSSNNSYHSSRRSSEDSLEEVNSMRDVRHELKELEEKFRKAMIANAQLDNEKAAVAYQVDLFKDRYEELEEQNLQLLREHKETCRQLEHTKRHRTKLQEDLEVTNTQLTELVQLIQEKGLVVVEGDCSSSDEESEEAEPRPKKRPKKALVSAEVADVLQQGSGSLDVRLKKFVEERNELVDELRRVKMELEEERAHSRGRHTNGPTDDSEDIQREANKLLGDYKFKLQKAEQDVNTLQATVARLESQVVRYKSAAETSEKLEDELKLEKRKLQRELREAQARVEELETSHSHLQRRLDKLKNAKSALLKDL
ncbi:leucine-rich repeat flightless-interacting protein 2 [Homalodisca vitripennis]|uniref:leucine-rich repeat flightless-interacting protein 2 n=1 Tax=Homalodisca vitripennis TaxID=197043 RepID=UPI001EEB1804|nr:leucine-rich repeat flightless-interacting protein 2 [Homalodisca vitripennis]XP_046678858.1 leucine-rich repeat flightless-interacting protein 2 [Homalodisca vitripennis]